MDLNREQTFGHIGRRSWTQSPIEKPLRKHPCWYLWAGTCSLPLKEYKLLLSHFIFSTSCRCPRKQRHVLIAQSQLSMDGLPWIWGQSVYSAVMFHGCSRWLHFISLCRQIISPFPLMACLMSVSPYCNLRYFWGQDSFSLHFRYITSLKNEWWWKYLSWVFDCKQMNIFRCKIKEETIGGKKVD